MKNFENQSQIELPILDNIDSIDSMAKLEEISNRATKTVKSVQIEPKMEIKSMENATPEKQVILNWNQSQSEDRLMAKIDELSKGDQVTINELYLQLSNTYAPNIATDGFPYINQLVSIHANLIRKVLRGIYSHELAIKGMRHLVDRFNKNEGINATKNQRDFCAEIMVNDFEYEFENDQLDSNLYPKYANKS